MCHRIRFLSSTCSAEHRDAHVSPGPDQRRTQPADDQQYRPAAAAPQRLRRNLKSTFSNRLIGARARTKVSPCMAIPLGFERWGPRKRVGTCSGHGESSGSGTCGKKQHLNPRRECSPGPSPCWSLGARPKVCKDRQDTRHRQ